MSKEKVKNPIAKAAQVIKHMDFSLFVFHFSLNMPLNAPSPDSGLTVRGGHSV